MHAGARRADAPLEAGVCVRVPAVKGLCNPRRVKPVLRRSTPKRGASRIMTLVFAALALSGCGGSINYDYGKEFDPRKHEDVIGPAVGLTINVWQNGDLS